DFNASFTASTVPVTVSWVLTIVGPNSGAMYQVSGTGSSFTNIQWGGSHTGLFFFRTGETAKATLSFMGSSLTKTIDVLIKRQASFNTCDATYPRNADFEAPVQVLPPSGNWASFNYPKGQILNVDQGITGIDDDTTQFQFDRNGNRVPSVQGKNFYYIKGLGESASFVSGLMYESGAATPVTSADPNDVWFNVYVYGSGDLNAGLDLEFHEADLPGDNAYDGKVDDSWNYHLELKHTGWKLISFKYADLTLSNNPDLGGHGNKKMEPNRFRHVAFVLLKKLNPNAPVEVFIDYPIFTYGAPFKPCK
ncbi:MAG: hypothetical protein K0R51_3507, partial [Cytophagaceae bacterium]|nr:hypothetical protein [Cytophagaceae bacterium]